MRATLNKQVKKAKEKNKKQENIAMCEIYSAAKCEGNKREIPTHCPK